MKIYLAPMEGVVDYVIRDLFTQIGGYDQCVTEFVRVTQRLLPKHVFYRYCPELNHRGLTRSGVPVYIQLLGGDPQLMGENAALAAELGAPGIDLNFGCPAKTVNRHDGGASLLKNPHRLFDVISAVKKSVPFATPVTAKVRLGFDHKDFAEEIAQAAEQAGATRLTVHARTKTEGYRPPAHWEYIGRMRQSVGIPVVANGDIWSVQEYLRCKEVSGCDDIALGRTAFACPDLAQQIKAATSEAEHKQLTWTDFSEKLLPQFIDASVAFGSADYTVARTKQWTKFLGRQYPQALTLFESIKRLKSIDEIRQVLAPERITPPAHSPLQAASHAHAPTTA